MMSLPMAAVLLGVTLAAAQQGAAQQGAASQPVSAADSVGTSPACTAVDLRRWHVALETHPLLDANAAKASRSRALGRVQSAWKPPSLYVDARGVPVTEPLNLGRTPMGGIGGGVRVPIPWLPRLAALDAAQAHEAKATELGGDEITATLMHRQLSLLVEDEQRRQQAQISRDQASLLRSLAEVARANASVGRAPASDSILLEARAATVDAQANAVTADRGALRQAWTSIAPSEPWPGCRFETSVIIGHDKTSAALLNRPAVQALESKASAAFRREGAASSQLIPEPTLAVAYVYRPDPTGADGVDFVTAQLSVPLPFLFGAPFAAEDVARADVARAQANRNAFLRHNRGQLRTLDARRKLQAARIRELETIASPLAKAASEVAQAAYSSGDGSVAPVLEAERTRLDIERSVIDSRAQLEQLELSRLRLLGALGASVAAAPE